MDTPTVKVAVYPPLGLPEIVAVSDETLSANTMSPVFDVGFCPFAA
jgi:hypothetical protein